MEGIMKHLFLVFLVLFGMTGCEKKEVIGASLLDNSVYSRIGKESMVLEIGASTCKSCIDMKKLIDKLKTENPNIPIHIIDVYEDKEAAAKFQIRMIPTQVVLNAKGEEIHRHVGGLSREELLELVEMAKSDKK